MFHFYYQYVTSPRCDNLPSVKNFLFGPCLRDNSTLFQESFSLDSRGCAKMRNVRSLFKKKNQSAFYDCYAASPPVRRILGNEIVLFTSGKVEEQSFDAGFRLA